MVPETEAVTQGDFTKWRHNLMGFFESSLDRGLNQLKGEIYERFDAIESDNDGIDADLQSVFARLDTLEKLTRLVLQALGVAIPPELAESKN